MKPLRISEIPSFSEKEVVKKAHAWLQDLKKKNYLSNRALGSVIGYRDLHFYTALERENLSLEQIRHIAKSQDVLQDFDSIFDTY